MRTPVLDDPSHTNHSAEKYTLFDLLCVGVGATVGSGVFVVTGQVAHEIAGPSVIFSWIVAGVACSLSALAYAELTCRWPSAGSSYTYVYATLGEFFAVLTAWALSLECGISGAAVARSWGAKVSALLADSGDLSDADSGFNVYAFFLQLVVVMVFLAGVDLSKGVVNALTVLKTAVILLMTLCGVSLFQTKHLQPLAPFGLKGVMKGATMCFFGFIGYDEVCCLAQETPNPRRDLPLAIFGTLLFAAVIYACSSLALVGMAPYQAIDSKNSFYSAFQRAGYGSLAEAVAAGELATMPLVVMASFLPQPRILYALARDRLFPACLALRDRRDNLRNAILLSGCVCTLVAGLLPYTTLNNMVSGGVLMSFNLTNMSLLLLRMNNRRGGVIAGEGDSEEAGQSAASCGLSLCEALIALYVGLAALLCMVLNGYTDCESFCDSAYQALRVGAVSLGALCLACIAVCLHLFCPGVTDTARNYRTKSDTRLFHAHQQLSAASERTEDQGSMAFRTPFLPYLPLAAIFLNTYLIVQLSAAELSSMVGFFTLATICYLLSLLLIKGADGADDYTTIPEVECAAQDYPDPASQVIMVVR
eukprot:gene27875-33660_t